jgi:hypothetical protein
MKFISKFAECAKYFKTNIESSCAQLGFMAATVAVYNPLHIN